MTRLHLAFMSVTVVALATILAFSVDDGRASAQPVFTGPASVDISAMPMPPLSFCDTDPYRCNPGQGAI